MEWRIRRPQNLCGKHPGFPEYRDPAFSKRHDRPLHVTCRIMRRYAAGAWQATFVNLVIGRKYENGSCFARSLEGRARKGADRSDHLLRRTTARNDIIAQSAVGLAENVPAPVHGLGLHDTVFEKKPKSLRQITRASRKRPMIGDQQQRAAAHDPRLDGGNLVRSESRRRRRVPVLRLNGR